MPALPLSGIKVIDDLNAMMPIMILFDDAREELDERLRA